MTEERQKVIVDWFSRQDHNELIGPLEAETWLKKVFGGIWVVNKTTQEGTFDKHWTYCISSAEEDFYWMELAIGDEWYYVLLGSRRDAFEYYAHTIYGNKTMNLSLSFQVVIFR